MNPLVCSRKTDNAFKVQSFGLASDDSAWNHGQFDQPLNDKAKCWHIRVPDFSVHTFRTQRSRTVKVRIEKSGTQKFSRPSRLKSPRLKMWTEKSATLMSLNLSINILTGHSVTGQIVMWPSHQKPEQMFGL